MAMAGLKVTWWFGLLLALGCPSSAVRVPEHSGTLASGLVELAESQAPEAKVDVPSNSCTNHVTAPVADTPGSWAGLVNQDVVCPEGGALASWQVITGEASTVMVNFTCCSYSSRLQNCEDKRQSLGGTGSVLQGLRGVDVSCSSNGKVLAGWRVTSAGSGASLDWRCCGLADQESLVACQDAQTTAQSVGNGGVTALAQHRPACRANELLQRWSLTSVSAGTQYVTHRCCSVGLALPLGRTGTCYWWGDPHFRPFDQTGPVTRWADELRSGRYWIVKSRYVEVQGEYCGWASVSSGPRSICQGSPALTRGMAVGGSFIRGNELVVQAQNGGVFWNGKRVDPPGTAEWRFVSDTGLITVQNRGSSCSIELPLGVRFQVTRQAAHLDVTMTMRQLPGGQDGHCGNFNGDVTDDTHEALQRRASSFVVPPELDLFGAVQGLPPPAGAPQRQTRTRCEGAALAWATAACQQRLPNATEEQRGWQQLCIFDTCELGVLAVAENALADEKELKAAVAAESPKPYVVGKPLGQKDAAAAAVESLCGATGRVLAMPKARADIQAVLQAVAAPLAAGQSALLGARWQSGQWRWADGTALDAAVMGSTVASAADGAQLCAVAGGSLVACSATATVVPVCQEDPRQYRAGALANPVSARSVACPSGQRLAMPKTAKERQLAAAAAKVQAGTTSVILGGRFTQGVWRWDDGTAVAADGIAAPPSPPAREAFLCLGMEDGSLRSCGGDTAASFSSLCETAFEQPTCPPGLNETKGVSYGGRCFYLAAANANCASTCQAIGGVCDSDGVALASETLSTCRFVVDAFGTLRYSPGASAVVTSSVDAGSGCVYSSAARTVSLMRPASPSCTASPVGAGQRRLCACGRAPPPQPKILSASTTLKPKQRLPAPLAGTSTICGGTAIREFLTAPKTAEEVRNIPWSQVDAVAREYIRAQTAEADRLTAEIARLRALIPERERLEAPQPLAQTQIQESVEAALRAPGSFGGASPATSSKCGAALVRPRPSWTPRVAFDKAVEAFAPAIRLLLQGGKFSSRSQAFSDTCNAFLAVRAGALDSNCDELCQTFAELAQAASDEFAGALAVNGKSADQLRREADQASAMLRLVQSEVLTCQQAQKDIQLFRGQLDTLVQDMGDKHGKVRDAQDALLDAQYELDDVQVAVDDQRAAVQEATRALQGRSAAAEDARRKLEAADKLSGSLKGSLQASQNELASAQGTLKSAQQTTDVVLELKAAVSNAMLKMMLYFDEAVRKPVRDMGLGEDKKVDNLFPSPLTELGSAKLSRQSMESLNTFCLKESTQRALAAGATGTLDPRELCRIGDVPALAKNVDEAVSSTVGLLKDLLQQVQSWLDPYRGQSAEERRAVLTNVQQGEPAGLREVLSAFGTTPFYREYLRHWQLKGRFLQVLAALEGALQRAKESHERATQRVAAAQTQLQDAEKALAAARAALKEALDSQAIAASRRDEAAAALAKLEASAAELQKTTQDLEAALAAAVRRWELARAALESAHREGVSLVELLEAIEGPTA